jgi:hypothetical protein
LARKLSRRRIGRHESVQHPYTKRISRAREGGAREAASERINTGAKDRAIFMQRNRTTKRIRIERIYRHDVCGHLPNTVTAAVFKNHSTWIQVRLIWANQARRSNENTTLVAGNRASKPSTRSRWARQFCFKCPTICAAGENKRAPRKVSVGFVTGRANNDSA